jgi:hypothetical protein
LLSTFQHDPEFAKELLEPIHPAETGAWPAPSRRHRHDRRRPKASRRAHRRHRGAAHLGLGDDPSRPCTYDRARRRFLGGSITLAGVPTRLLLARARALTPLSAPVSQNADRGASGQPHALSPPLGSIHRDHAVPSISRKAAALASWPLRRHRSLTPDRLPQPDRKRSFCPCQHSRPFFFTRRACPSG